MFIYFFCLSCVCSIFFSSLSCICLHIAVPFSSIKYFNIDIKSLEFSYITSGAMCNVLEKLSFLSSFTRALLPAYACIQLIRSIICHAKIVIKSLGLSVIRYGTLIHICTTCSESHFFFVVILMLYYLRSFSAVAARCR
ncbi:hypothetical protein FB567DRAFT_179787 [Paraphoma chrysanthemicola]|uniref:Uncharacterized protein n=1 Tax=Paraphoma chrysanthemicola TaxID=798071 RepID=A0A8K0RFU6_9PLEO|nr:hypothetical protein FB567DRAFT_179787 [Paraphoma chrysanthemicola]